MGTTLTRRIPEKVIDQQFQYTCNKQSHATRKGVKDLLTTTTECPYYTSYADVHCERTLFHYLLTVWSRYPGRLRTKEDDMIEGQSVEELDNINSLL